MNFLIERDKTYDQMTKKESSLPLVEPFRITDSQSRKKLLETMYGLVDLRRCLINEGQDQSTLEAVNTRISEFVSNYNDVFGSSRHLGAELVGKGYINNIAQILDSGNVTEKSQIEENFSDLKGVAIVGVAGLIRAGKGTVGKILAETYNGIHTPFVNSLIAFSYALGYQPGVNRAALREVNDIVKPRFGYDTFAQCTLDQTRRLWRRRNPVPFVLSFDGFRSEPEANLIINMGGTMVAVEASIEERYRRSLMVQPGDEAKNVQIPKSFDDFKRDNEIEERWMRPAINLAEIKFDNNKYYTVVSLEPQVTTYFDKKLDFKDPRTKESVYWSQRTKFD